MGIQFQFEWIMLLTYWLALGLSKWGKKIPESWDIFNFAKVGRKPTRIEGGIEGRIPEVPLTS